MLVLIKKTAHESAWVSGLFEYSRNPSPGTYHKWTPAPHKITSTGRFCIENFTSFLSHKDDGQRRDEQNWLKLHQVHAAGYDIVFFNMDKSICCSREWITSLGLRSICDVLPFAWVQSTHKNNILFSPCSTLSSATFFLEFWWFFMILIIHFALISTCLNKRQAQLLFQHFQLIVCLFVQVSQNKKQQLGKTTKEIWTF